MISIKYEDIFSDFLGDIEDYNLASLSVSDANEEMVEYFHKALRNPYIRRLFKTLNIDDTIQEISFEMRNKIDDEADKDFIINILSKEMLVVWLRPFINKTSLINQRVTSSKESKFYSQSQHLTELTSLLEDTKTEVRQIIRDRGYVSRTYSEG